MTAASAPAPVPDSPWRVPQSQGSGFVEELSFGEGFNVHIERYRLIERFEALVHGADMIKFHVRLSGRRMVTFDRCNTLALDDTATVVLMHDADLPKMDHVLANHDETSITIVMKRQRLLENLDVLDSDAPAVLDRVMRRYAHTPRMVSAAPSRREVQLAREIIDCRCAAPLRRMFLQAKALELMCSVLDHLSGSRDERTVSIRLTANDRRRLQQVRELLEASVMETLRLDDLARRFGLNRNKLCTGFRALFGVSIFDFASRLKMDEARRMLQHSQLTVSEIAQAIGYSSAGAFSGAFHRHFGHSPTDARRPRA